MYKTHCQRTLGSRDEWAQYGGGVLSDHSLLSPQIRKRTLWNRINETKLKAVLWDYFFLVSWPLI